MQILNSPGNDMQRESSQKAGGSRGHPARGTGLALRWWRTPAGIARERRKWIWTGLALMLLASVGAFTLTSVWNYYGLSMPVQTPQSGLTSYPSWTPIAPIPKPTGVIDWGLRRRGTPGDPGHDDRWSGLCGNGPEARNRPRAGAERRGRSDPMGEKAEQRRRLPSRRGRGSLICRNASRGAVRVEPSHWGDPVDLRPGVLDCRPSYRTEWRPVCRFGQYPCDRRAHRRAALASRHGRRRHSAHPAIGRRSCSNHLGRQYEPDRRVERQATPHV